MVVTSLSVASIVIRLVVPGVIRPASTVSAELMFSGTMPRRQGIHCTSGTGTSSVACQLSWNSPDKSRRIMPVIGRPTNQYCVSSRPVAPSARSAYAWGSPAS